MFLLGALNFSVFWAMLFVAAYRLPGGVAATLGAIQPLLVIALARLLLGAPVRGLAVLAAAAGPRRGAAGAHAQGGAGPGRRGRRPGQRGLDGAGHGAQSPLATARVGADLHVRQLTAGGILLAPAALLAELALPAFSLLNVAGIAYLGLIGAALTHVLWFRGVARLEPAVVSRWLSAR